VPGRRYASRALPSPSAFAVISATRGTARAGDLHKGSVPRVLNGHPAAERVPEHSPLLKIQVLARHSDRGIDHCPNSPALCSEARGHGEAASDGAASIRDLRFRGVAESQVKISVQGRKPTLQAPRIDTVSRTTMTMGDMS
jgi:hypothetical protein